MATNFSKLVEMYEQARMDFIEAEDRWIANPKDEGVWQEYDKASLWWSYLEDQLTSLGIPS